MTSWVQLVQEDDGTWRATWAGITVTGPTSSAALRALGTEQGRDPNLLSRDALAVVPA